MEHEESIGWAVGTPSDGYIDETVMGRLEQMLDHIHSVGRCHPTGEAGVTVTAGNAAPWTLGEFVEIVELDDIMSPFDLHFVNFEGMSANATYELVLYDTAGLVLARVRATRSTNQDRNDAVPVIMRIQPAGGVVKAKVMSSSGNADTVTVSVFYHIY